jgi:hypothetical protein
MISSKYLAITTITPIGSAGLQRKTSCIQWSFWKFVDTSNTISIPAYTRGLQSFYLVIFVKSLREHAGVLQLMEITQNKYGSIRCNESAVHMVPSLTRGLLLT